MTTASLNEWQKSRLDNPEKWWSNRECRWESNFKDDRIDATTAEYQRLNLGLCGSVHSRRVLPQCRSCVLLPLVGARQHLLTIAQL
jgi:hypothetical protein